MVEMEHRTDYVVFNLEDQRFAISLDSVERVIPVVEITPLPDAPSVILGVINVAGQIIPVYNMRLRFKHAQKKIELCDQILLATSQGLPIGLYVDNVAGVLQIEDISITKPPENLSEKDYVQGMAKMEDGLIIIHDLQLFLSRWESKKLKTALKRIGTNKGKLKVEKE